MAEGASPRAPYVALGDSVADWPRSYVNRLFPHYQSTLGVTELSNRARSGETSGSIRAGGQLYNALADINAASDTRAVTIDIGANDRSRCAGRWDSCPFRNNLFATLSDLGAALDSDPGAESFAAMAYYNPASGLGGDGERSESYYDRGLLGTDLVIDCEITAGPQVGINDIIYQEAGRRGALVADPYLAFKAGGQAFMADSIHPNGAGHAAIAAAFREASPVCPEAGGLPPPGPGLPPPRPPRLVRYDTKLTIANDRGLVYHGNVESEVSQCEVGRRVAVLKQRPGTDRLLGAVRSGLEQGEGSWGMRVPQAKTGWRVYARARRTVRPGIGLVCRRDRSPIYTVQ